MDPQQEIFTELLLKIRALGYGVYDGALPPEDTPYPFVYMGEVRQTDHANKAAVFGAVYQTIHVWSDNPRRRGEVSQMLLGIKRVCRETQSTRNFGWMLVNANQRILPDNTTNTPLLHGMLEVEYKFN